MFLDSASRLQRPYGTREKSASVILAVVNRLVANMGISRTFRADSGTEYSNELFVDFRSNHSIRWEFTPPFTPLQYGPVESAIWRAFKAGNESPLGVQQLYPDV